MTKTEALLEILYESRRSRQTIAGAKRMIRACMALEIEDPMKVYSSLEYADPDGHPHDILASILLGGDPG